MTIKLDGNESPIGDEGESPWLLPFWPKLPFIQKLRLFAVITWLFWTRWLWRH